MNDSSVALMNAEINRELASADVRRALLATTFKGLNEMVMRQAVLEGVLRGFTFKDFLQKNVYAIPFKEGYSLVTSIDYARKRGARAGIVGKDAPVYVMDGKKIISCSVTVHRKVVNYVGTYTAEVYFEEYTTGRNLWISKPRTMIAKVAEMHALRMACPEELSQVYTEEEMQAEATVPHEPMVPYRIERVLRPEEDEAQGKRVQPIDGTGYEVEEPVETQEEKESTPTELKLQIGKLLKEKAKFTVLGKKDEVISDKIFDLVGILYVEENYKAIVEELKSL
jgi:hypothetical protein